MDNKKIRKLIASIYWDLKKDYKEMDLYCYSCKSEDYKISDWYIKQNKSFFKGIEYLFYNNQRRIK